MNKAIFLAVMLVSVDLLAIDGMDRPQLVPCKITIDNKDYIDTDCDYVPDYFNGRPMDNCPEVKNGPCDKDILYCDIDGDGMLSDVELNGGHQADWDANGVGNACDDTDKDGFDDAADICVLTYNPKQQVGDCVDTDGDHIEDRVDNCPNVKNPGQEDQDMDGIGDKCDNCPEFPNPFQEDRDGDGRGDICPRLKKTIEANLIVLERPNRMAGGVSGCSVSKGNFDEFRGGVGIFIFLLSALPLLVINRFKKNRSNDYKG